MTIRVTLNHPPEGVETLDLQTAHSHEGNRIEYVRIAVVPEEAVGDQGIVSLMLIQFSDDMKCKTLQTCLLLSEVSMLIAGLREARKRVLKLNKEKKLSEMK